MLSNSNTVSVLILFDFHSKNGLIINSLHIIDPNNLKPSWCTPTHQSFFKIQECGMKCSGLGDFSITKQNKTKQTALLHK
jgi:hypothetical protein